MCSVSQSYIAFQEESNSISFGFPTAINTGAACSQCESCVENWMCLSCRTVACGRYVNEHMQMHCLESEHPLVMSLRDFSVWCYACSSYIDHPRLYAFLNAAHLDKFREPMAWTHVCPQRADGCYPMGPDGRDEDDGAAGCSSGSNICIQLERNQNN